MVRLPSFLKPPETLLAGVRWIFLLSFLVSTGLYVSQILFPLREGVNSQVVMGLSLIWLGMAICVIHLLTRIITKHEQAVERERHVQAEMHRRESEQRFRSLVQHSSDVITLVEADGTITYQTPSVRHVCGYEPDTLIGQPIVNLLHPVDVAPAQAFLANLAADPGKTLQTEWRLRHHNGAWLDVEIIGTNLLDDPIVGKIVLNCRDVTERRQLEELLTHQAFHDPLTGLANHRALVTTLDQELERAQRSNQTCALLFLDLDHFKALNDSCGHPAGDTALQAFGALVRETLRDIDTIGRWGGEEFMALVPGVTSAGALAIAERLRAAVASYTFPVGGGIHMTCSIGVALFPQQAHDRDSLITAADSALYTAKHLGRNQVRLAGDESASSIVQEGSRDTGSREETALMGTVEAITALVEARDHYTGEHGNDVERLTMRLALALGCDAGEARRIALAARLHDIGKAAIPDAILQKPGCLSPDEWRAMHRHPAIGADIVSHVPGLRGLAPLIRAHHEHWDGNGYPSGISGEKIPLGARIIAVADAYGAMTSNRPYRQAITPSSASAELRRCAGTQFDPTVVDALERILTADPLTAYSAAIA